jgi:hypothetical protein
VTGEVDGRVRGTKGDDLGVTNGPGLPWAAGGCGLAEAEVSAVIMVIGNVVSQQAKQVAVVEDDDVVEELAADAADPVAELIAVR